MQEDERLHPAWSGNLRAGFVSESLTGGALVHICCPTMLPSCWKGLSHVTPFGAGALKQGNLGLEVAGGGWEGLGARTSARDFPLPLGVLPHYVQICRRGEPKALFCFAKGADIWHSLGNNWLQSCPFLGFPAQGSELDHFLVYKRLLFCPSSVEHRIERECTRCRGNLFLKDGFWKLE